jgi:hypothetical protein
LGQQRLKEIGVDALDLAGEQMVDSLDDPKRVSNDHVRRGGSKIVGRQALENLVGQAIGGRERQVERRGVGHAGPVEVRRLVGVLVRERPDLRRGAMDEHDTDVQRPEQRDVQQ